MSCDEGVRGHQFPELFQTQDPLAAERSKHRVRRVRRGATHCWPEEYEPCWAFFRIPFGLVNEPEVARGLRCGLALLLPASSDVPDMIKDLLWISLRGLAFCEETIARVLTRVWLKVRQ